MDNLTTDEVLHLRRLRDRAESHLGYSAEVKSALDKILADYPKEPEALGTPILATCVGHNVEHLHILTTGVIHPWACRHGRYRWDELTGSRKEPTNSQLHEMNYWEPEERWITNDEIKQVSDISGFSTYKIREVVRAMGFRVEER